MKFELTILGCGSAIPTLSRIGTAQALNVLERYFLIDCAEGTQHALRKNKIPYNKINHIFISHLHGDHFFGLLGFLSTLSLQNRRGEMHIYADRRLEELFIMQMELLKIKLNYPLIYHTLSKEQTLIYEDNCVTVESFPVKHRYDCPCWGFLFREKERPRSINKEMVDAWKVPIAFYQHLKSGMDYIDSDGRVVENKRLTLNPPKARSYAFITDSVYREKHIPIVEGVDLLYHESTYCETEKELAKKTGHSTAKQAATLADKAHVKQLLLGHYSARYIDPTPLYEEAIPIFSKVVLAEDGLKISIPLK